MPFCYLFIHRTGNFIFKPWIKWPHDTNAHGWGKTKMINLELKALHFHSCLLFELASNCLPYSENNIHFISFFFFRLWKAWLPDTIAYWWRMVWLGSIQLQERRSQSKCKKEQRIQYIMYSIHNAFNSQYPSHWSTKRNVCYYLHNHEHDKGPLKIKINTHTLINILLDVTKRTILWTLMPLV